jgi:1-piperideine-2-carboxylate/1-pyrroline-2-carboxylate reductase [NAD(P)H]
MVEIPEDLLCNRRIVVDYLPGAKQEAGDLMRANINWLRVSEISQEIDRKPFQNTEATVFKTVGHACWDLAAARIAVSKIRNG